MDASSRETVARAIAAAYAGKLKWVHKLIIKAGYRRGWFATSDNEAAAFFGVSATTIKKWRSLGCDDKDEHGHSLVVILRFRDEKTTLQQSEETPAGAVPKHARDRREHYLAELARLKFERETGKLVSLDRHERELTARSSYFVKALKWLPPKVGPMVAGKPVAECTRVIKRCCREIQKMAFGESDD